MLKKKHGGDHYDTESEDTTNMDETQPGQIGGAVTVAAKPKEKPIVVKVILKVMSDPLVIMTFLGVIGRVGFWGINYKLLPEVGP